MPRSGAHESFDSYIFRAYSGAQKWAFESQRRGYILWFSFLSKFSRVSKSSMAVVVGVVSNDCCYCRYRQFNILPKKYLVDACMFSKLFDMYIIRCYAAFEIGISNKMLHTCLRIFSRFKISIITLLEYSRARSSESYNVTNFCCNNIKLCFEQR